MVYFSLPYFYENYQFNHFLKDFVLKHPEKTNFEKERIVIKEAFGSFPYCFWNGDNSNIGENNKVLLYDDILSFYKKNFMSISFDCSNVFLVKNDFYNSHIKMIFNIFSNAGHSIKISNLDAKNILEKIFSGYEYILSKNAFIDKEVDIEILNDLLEIEDFKYIEIPYYIDLNILKNLNKKNKALILLNSPCQQCNNKTFFICRKEENYNQINYSEKRKFDYCHYNFSEKDLYNQFDLYYQNNFRDFQIEAPAEKDLNKFNNMLIKFFIKKEFWSFFEEQFEIKRSQLNA